MNKNANKNNFGLALLVAAALSLVACGRQQTPVPQTDVSVHAPAGVMEAEDMTLPTVIERRHFAIYNTYRVLFDDSPQVFQSRAGMQEEGLQPAVMPVDGLMPSCSMRAILLQD